jgi:hypothetical protein
MSGIYPEICKKKLITAFIPRNFTQAWKLTAKLTDFPFLKKTFS